MQQERLRVLGQMASGVAHDINNAISPVALYTDSLLEHESGLSERLRSYLNTTQRAIRDVAQTISRMREFYRPQEPQLVLARINLNLGIQQVVDLTRVRWRDVPQERGVVIAVELELAGELPAVLGAENELRDALTNLIFNAVDAMPDGGTLSIRTRARVTKQASDLDPTAVALLEVCDTGVGMDEETKRRCVEPFFTTKAGRGTGLGLAMVYGMVRRHGAELEIDTAPGKGTTMRLIFPAVAVAPGSQVPNQAAQRPVQPLNILIIDDDPIIIESLREILQRDGHQVTTASGGQLGIDAFVVAQKHRTKLDVVITDLGMPYVDGRHVAMAVKNASPDTPVILLTGWGQRLLDEGEVPPHVNRVLNKPPKLPEIRRALADLVRPSESAT